MKKVLSFTLTLMLVVMVLTSCSSVKPPIKNDTTPDNDHTVDEPVVSTDDTEDISADDEDDYFERYYSKADEVIELTQNMQAGGPGVVWEEGDSIDNNNYTRWAERAVGIRWKAKWNAVSPEEDVQKLNLAMASDDLPDVIRAYTSSDVIKMAKAGQIIPLNDPINEYLSPLSKHLFNEMNESTDGMHFKMNYYEGKLYGLGSYADMVTPRANFWRKDILEELGYDTPPRTIEEVEKVFADYKAKYPEGICINLDKDLDYGVNAVFLAYGTQVRSWREQPDGSLAYAPILPQTKDALAKLAEWYDKGYIDKEFIVKDYNNITSDWAAGNMLMEQREWWAGWEEHIYLQANIDTAEITCGDYWVGPTGEWGSMQIKPNEFEQYCINSKLSEDAVKAIMTQINFFNDSAFRAHKDLRDKFPFYYPYEEEKKPYNLEEIAAAYKSGDKQIPREKYDIPEEREGPSNGQNSWMAVSVPQAQQFGYRYNQRPNQLRNDFKANEKPWKAWLAGDDEVKFSVEFEYMIESWSRSSIEALFENIKFAEKSEEEGHSYFDMQWCAATPTQLEKGAYLLKLEMTTFADIIMGSKPVDAFDDFVDEWFKNGGTEITEEVNSWWDSVKDSVK